MWLYPNFAPLLSSKSAAFCGGDSPKLFGDVDASHTFEVNWNLNVILNSPVTNLNEPIYDKTIYDA